MNELRMNELRMNTVSGRDTEKASPSGEDGRGWDVGNKAI